MFSMMSLYFVSILCKVDLPFSSKSSARATHKIIDNEVYKGPTDFLGLLSDNLPKNFATNRIAETSGMNLNIARKMAYTLRKIGVIEDIAS